MTGQYPVGATNVTTRFESSVALMPRPARALSMTSLLCLFGIKAFDIGGAFDVG